MLLFILEFLPSWVFLALFAVGALGLLATYFLKLIPIPMFYVYKTPIQIASIVAMVIATFMYGGAYNNDSWLAKVKEMEDKVAVAEAKAAEVNVKIEEKIVERTQVVKEKGDTIVKYIDRYKDREVLKEVPGPERVRVEEVIKFVENCPIPKEMVDIHNQAAELVKGEKK